MSGKVGLDTNVALRWLVQDTANLAQSQLAMTAIDGQDAPVHINLVVLAELMWLAAQSLKLGRGQQATLVRGMLNHPFVDMADSGIVENALNAFETGGAGFTDHLIAALNFAAGCTTTLTFDKTAAKGENFTLLH